MSCTRKPISKDLFCAYVCLLLLIATSTSLKWSATGITVIGTGAPGTGSNQLNAPYGLAIDSLNTLFVTEQSNNRAQMILAGSSTGSTVAGQSTGGWGTGPTYLYSPSGIVVDSGGNIYIADAGNHRVQYWASGGLSGTTIAGTGK